MPDATSFAEALMIPHTLDTKDLISGPLPAGRLICAFYRGKFEAPARYRYLGESDDARVREALDDYTGDMNRPATSSVDVGLYTVDSKGVASLDRRIKRDVLDGSDVEESIKTGVKVQRKWEGRHRRTLP
jgi:hypothetical protein